MSAISMFYDLNAVELAQQYDTLDFETVHQSWRCYWPQASMRVLDVGAGSGRDARWFHLAGCDVTAVEPAKALRELGVLNSSSQITWLDDELPNLLQLTNGSQLFDLILVSAVWMHLKPEKRQKSLDRLTQCLSHAGKIVITLRHGEFSDDREAYNVSVGELKEFGENSGLIICRVAVDEDALQRKAVFWQTVVLEKRNGAV